MERDGTVADGDRRAGKLGNAGFSEETSEKRENEPQRFPTKRERDGGKGPGGMYSNR